MSELKSPRDRSDFDPVSPLPVEYQVALPTLGVRPNALLTPNDNPTPGGESRGLHKAASPRSNDSLVPDEVPLPLTLEVANSSPPQAQVDIAGSTSAMNFLGQNAVGLSAFNSRHISSGDTAPSSEVSSRVGSFKWGDKDPSPLNSGVHSGSSLGSVPGAESSADFADAKIMTQAEAATKPVRQDRNQSLAGLQGVQMRRTSGASFLNQQKNKQHVTRGIVPEEISPAQSPSIDGGTSGSLSSFLAGPRYQGQLGIADEAARLKPKSLHISNSPLGTTNSKLRSAKNTTAAWGGGGEGGRDKEPRSQSARSPKTTKSTPSRIGTVRGLGAMLTRALPSSKSKMENKDPAGTKVRRQSSVRKLKAWVKTKQGKGKVAPDDESKTSTLHGVGPEKGDEVDLPDTPVLADAKIEEPATPILTVKERVKKATRRLSVIRQMSMAPDASTQREKGKGLKRSNSFSTANLTPLERELSGVVPFRICVPMAGLRNGWDLVIVVSRGEGRGEGRGGEAKGERGNACARSQKRDLGTVPVSWLWLGTGQGRAAEEIGGRGCCRPSFCCKVTVCVCSGVLWRKN
jgi:hypothetical protein